jgi:heavy metal efflux system protein
VLDNIIKFSIHNKLIIGIMTLALIIWGLWNATRLPIDALPDITNNQVQIITSSPTLAAQEIEKFITYPIEQSVKPIPRIVELRSISRFGLSSITVVFEEDVDIYWARSQIIERIKEAEENIPEGMGTPELAPISTGLGEILQYTISAKEGFEDKISPTELRSLQDWVIKPQLTGTKGVAEVNTLGGMLKQYEVMINPAKLASMNVTMTEIFDALSKNNENTGGAYIDKIPTAYFIRGIGMVGSLEDIQKIVIKNRNSIPILVRDVADVGIGNAIRYGATTENGEGEVVNGMVMMLKGENSASVVTEVKAKLETIKKTLPEGVQIKPYLDRSKLVDNAIGTVKTNLIEGALIVVFILVLLLGNWKAGLIVASVIPLALLFAVSMMNMFGVSGNLMSLGAIDFGLIVDGAVIIVEAIVHRLSLGRIGALSSDKSALTQAEMDDTVYDASAKIRNSAAFGEIIILIVYIPILALVGTEGKMFKPMAQTVSFAIFGAFLLSLTYVPMMSALFLDKLASHKVTISDRIINFCYRYYRPILEAAMQMKGAIIGVAVLFFVLALLVFNKLGGEFIPTLEEGDIATHVMLPGGSSLAQEILATTASEKILKEKFPEVIQVVSKIGSAEIPTDPMPMEVADVMVILKPKSEWTSAKTKEELMEKMEHELENLPGVTTEFTQPIQMRFNELMTGVRSDVAIKIFGEDIDLLVGFGDQVVSLIQNVNGVQDARAEAVSGLPQITVKYNKDKLALYGLNITDINRVIRTGFAGEKAGVVYEGEKRYDMVVRLDKANRQDIDDLKSLFVQLPSGSQIPLDQVADVAYERGFSQISREDGKRRIVIGFNVRNRDVKSVVEEIQAKMDKAVELPVGYYTTYGGQFQNLVEANKRLSVAVPVALGLIFVLLFFTFGSVKHSILIFTAIPLSAIGGVFALWMRGMPFSISAGVGFIALFGVAVLNGIVLIGYFNQLKKEGMTDIMDIIREGTKVRLRPIIMTAAVASLGFLPMALSTGAGAEVQKPLATVVIGGLLSATILTLIILPILYFYFEKKFSIKMERKTISVIIMLFTFTFVNGQVTTYTLPQVLNLAFENNHMLKAQKYNIEAQQALTKSSSLYPKTDFNAQLGQNNSRQFDENFSISQDIPNPAKRRSQRKLAEANVGLAQYGFEVSKNDLTYQVKTSWYELLYLYDLKKLLSKEDSLVRTLIAAADLKLTTGESSALGKMIAMNEQGEIFLQRRQVDVDISAQLDKLSVLGGVNINGISESSLSQLGFDPLSPSNSSLNNPSILFMQQKVAVSASELAVEENELKPDYTLGYFIQSFNGPQEIDSRTVYYNSTPRFQGVNLGLNLPIFGRRAYQAKANAAKARILAAQEENEQFNLSQTRTLQALVSKYLAALDQLSFYTKTGLPNAKLIIKNATAAFKNGDIDYVEYLNALRAHNETERAYLSAIRSVNEAVLSVEYLTKAN